ncbi:hypothetical protein C6V83_00135 [Gordonia iterans]|uniref:Uncharacterized protein n=1 Tax=Gordonia iterans TaxID=1004901 RepID=A0A2S0KB91_9ACTN|nr:hypothetical protein [Gordonia iterans]AVL98925.1 hypothetical protein C6V83_00135 [Gordonia iterans]
MSTQQSILGSLGGVRLTAVRIGEILGVTEKTARKRLADGLNASDVITLCRALDVNPVEALVELKFVTINEAIDFADSDGQLLATADEEQLFLELVDRKLSTPRLAQILAERTSAPHAGSIGTDDTMDLATWKMRRAEKEGLTGVPPTDEEVERVRRDEHRMPRGMAARTLDGKSDGEKIDDEFAELGEESQDPGDTDPA